MVTSQLKKHVMKTFFKTYKTFLKNYIYKKDEEVRKIFKDSQSINACELVAESYLNSAIEFYQENPKGTYSEEQKHIANDPNVKKNLDNYSNIVPDDFILGYLQVYVYSIEELGNVIYDKNGDVKKDIKVLTNNGLEYHTLQDYLSVVINKYSTEMFRRVFKDIKAGNYWWLKDTATTLRRQLFDNFVYVNTDRFKLMCKKYLEMDMSDKDIQDKLMNAVNGGIRLGEILDKKMLESHNAKPYYCWWEINKEKKILHLADEPPKTGVYTYVAYHTNMQTKQNQKDSYFF